MFFQKKLLQIYNYDKEYAIILINAQNSTLLKVLPVWREWRDPIFGLVLESARMCDVRQQDLYCSCYNMTETSLVLLLPVQDKGIQFLCQLYTQRHSNISFPPLSSHTFPQMNSSSHSTRTPNCPLARKQPLVHGTPTSNRALPCG